METTQADGLASTELRVKQDADYIFHELTRSICPECKTVIDAQIIIRDNKVFMRKRYPSHGCLKASSAPTLRCTLTP